MVRLSLSRGARRAGLSGAAALAILAFGAGALAQNAPSAPAPGPAAQPAPAVRPAPATPAQVAPSDPATLRAQLQEAQRLAEQRLVIARSLGNRLRLERGRERRREQLRAQGQTNRDSLWSATNRATPPRFFNDRVANRQVEGAAGQQAVFGQPNLPVSGAPSTQTESFCEFLPPDELSLFDDCAPR